MHCKSNSQEEQNSASWWSDFKHWYWDWENCVESTQRYV